MKKKLFMIGVKESSILSEMEKMEVYGGSESKQELAPNDPCRQNESCDQNYPCSENTSCENNQSCSGNRNCKDKTLCNAAC